MKTHLFILMLLLGVCIQGNAQNQSHSECRDPTCLGLLASCSVNFHNSEYVTVTIPKPPYDVVLIQGPFMPQWHVEGSSITITLRRSPSDSGIALLDVVVTKYSDFGYQCFYHVELNVTGS